MEKQKKNFEILSIENERILRRFAEQGVDLSKAREVEFSVELPDKEACKELRARIRALGTMPKNTSYIIASYPEGPSLVISVPMKPRASSISEIEAKLSEAARVLGGAEVYWGFED